MVHLPKLESDETSEAAEGAEDPDQEPITVEMIGEGDEMDEITQVRRQRRADSCLRRHGPA